MKRAITAFAVVSLAVALSLTTGCEWTGGGGTDSFNTSQGAGVSINFSGVYDGTFGGRAVKSTSAGNINRLTITQSGDTLEVRDNQGSRYYGKVGSPGSVVDLADGLVIPAGANIVQSQVSWSGKDEVAAKDVEFVGVIHAVSVTDIQGDTRDTTAEQTKENSDSQQTTTTSVVNTNGTTTTVLTIGTPEDAFYQQITTVTDNQTGKEISRTVVKNSGSTSTDTQTSTAEYTLTEANTQYRLEGTWVEKGGVSSDVDAISPGGVGSVTLNTTTE
jgi:hypothetical protein